VISTVPGAVTSSQAWFARGAGAGSAADASGVRAVTVAGCTDDVNNITNINTQVSTFRLGFDIFSSRSVSSQAFISVECVMLSGSTAQRQSRRTTSEASLSAARDSSLALCR
jgi:hypothetical protein